MAGKDVGLPFLSSGAGEGSGSRERYPSEEADLLKFILFFFTVKKSRIQESAGLMPAVAGHFSVTVRPIFRR